MEDLAEIRRRGYATDDEEHELGVACVATPVLDATGLPLAAISVSGPTPRMTDTAGLAELLRGHAADVSAALGRLQASGGPEPAGSYSAAAGSTLMTRPRRPSLKSTVPAARA